MKDSTPRLALSPTEKEARASFQDVCFYPTGDLLSAEIDFVFIIDIDLVEEAIVDIIKAFDSPHYRLLLSGRFNSRFH